MLGGRFESSPGSRAYRNSVGRTASEYYAIIKVMGGRIALSFPPNIAGYDREIKGKRCLIDIADNGSL